MTGYGSASEETQGWTVSAEFRAVNHRGLDLRIVLPSELHYLEPKIRREIKSRCCRGRIECRVSLESPIIGLNDSPHLDTALTLKEALSTLATHLNLDAAITLQDLFAAGFNLNQQQKEKPNEALEAPIMKLVGDALKQLDLARLTEGKALTTELSERLNGASLALDEIDALHSNLATGFRARLQERLGIALEELGNTEKLDEHRLIQEIAIYVDRSDITEEIVRAHAHILELTGLISREDLEHSPHGKRIDFFLQELGRESNTMGSKSHSSDMVCCIVELKSNIERLREQAMNIE
jgi:uncharacterized protein (TIGR00255 family)